ncbi:high affinity cAMP-specific and IBMX-insensitive 3',5'-cyclic phosphodiesterase 8B-like [Acanthaster planci]|uniref:Phosphodiesterase n=1 Tax=Acanthaster planci TaxID=133434 RepID=A0A8B7ZPH5_ACAPL|nr:high affinity cAMP-specific and IBMX-insensitive 3',5'-cyclic phosphodiesterase 8B-like [Acanthaster planci]XP_022106804.1 high affinity cAMP-specific and IBMX-insensitive 3',5'-cyclic phosphodiesterase 8B-like [Acanthaster planci]XP_022106805.1 high affinity cAMP-specific and IBMX-insensitive 3',5'-cyclic phosphodiesterase 8B-like [Acanthaster planci]XP_022106806.1 high affinity cAMP-specific and IBMX-insensitive 3',5'-cyclic phosphodiesterase 8B-like [Acanthaster planci]XP_022106807.1 high
MGCAPSITVSQSGVVYCRDSDESNSPKPSFSQQQIVHIRTGNAPELSDTGISTTGTAVTVYNKKERRGTISIEAETQTSKSTVSMKGTTNEVTFGPMKVCQRTMQVLLVFSKEDALSDSFWWAADKGGYKCNIVRNPTDALECFVEKQHDVIIIDHRNSKNFDAVALCRSVRATKFSDHIVLVAVTRKSSADRDESSVIPLLNAGFNRRIIENSNAAACLNELVQLECVDVRSQLKLRAANALFEALDACTDSVEITSENHVVQYVNSAYEQLTGYSGEEILDREVDDIHRDKNKAEQMDSIYSQLKKTKPWEGLLFSKKKNGESVPQFVHISPIIGQGGRVRHHVFNIKNPVGMISQSMFSQELQHIDKITSDFSNGTSVRRHSMARIHSMTIEAPITKVINIINAAQENSPGTVVQALDRVLEILRSSELYNPQLSAQHVKEEDQMTTDLVGGLMTHGGYSARRRMSGSEIALSKTTSSSRHSPSSPSSHMTQVPVEIQKILERDPAWDFNILDLERITLNRPLIYLGLKVFNRFKVGSFLGISETVLRNWLQVIEANYHSSNPYHNSTHAADVMQATAYFIGKEKLKTCFEPADEVASLIAATVHDIDHPGRTNSFLCNAASDLAILYNDIAVLESHHAALAFQLTTREDRCNIFKELDREDYRAMRHTIVDMILATEMTKHFEHLSKFVNCINKPVLRDGEDTLSMQSTGRSTPDSSSFANPENRALIRRMLIKCADVSNPTRPLDMCMLWARRISEEYFAQTDEEKKRGLPVVMPVFDRMTCSIPKSQISFTEYFIMDMFDAWDAFIDCPEVMENLRYNYKYWTTEEEKERMLKEERD